MSRGEEGQEGDESFRAEELNVALTVDDLAESVGWYRDGIGFAVDKRHEREGRLVAASLRAGSVRLLLSQDDGARGPDRVKGEGLSMRFTTRQDLDELARRAEAYGVKIVTPPTETPWGERVFRVEDPNGFKLAFTSVRD